MNDFENTKINSKVHDSFKRYAPGKILIMTLLGIASWETAALIYQFAIISVFPSLKIWGMISSMSIIAFCASLLFGIINKSMRLIIGGVLAGLFGMVTACYIATALTFMFFNNDFLSPYGNISIVIFTTVLFILFYSAAAYGKKAVGIFVMAGLIVSIPFGIFFMLISKGTIPFLEPGSYSINPLVLSPGTAVGLASGLYQASLANNSTASKG